MALSIGLATFAVAGWTVARHNQSIRAGFDVGASRVLVVHAPPGVDLVTAVRHADPSARQAMAVVVEHAPDGDLIAVDSTRMAAVASWPPTLTTTSVQSISRSLVPRTAPVVTVSGPGLRVTADVEAALAVPAPQLEAVVSDNSFHTFSTVDVGPLESGRHIYQGSLAGDCSPSCRLVDLELVWTPPGSEPEQSTDVALTVAAIADQADGGSWSPVGARLGDPRDWRSGSGGVGLRRGTGGLAVNATVDADGAPATFGPADVPITLPAVVTGPGGTSVALDGATISVRVVATVSALPVIGTGNSATMVDLPLVERLQSGPMMDATAEVWLAPGAEHRIEAQLGRSGISVVAVKSVTADETRLSKSGVSLAYALFLLAAVAAGVLAVGSTIFMVSVTARRRTVELASLAAVGVTPRTLRRSLVLEQLLVLGVGLSSGIVAGAVATVAALPSIPETFAPGPAPPLDLGLPSGAIGVIALAVTVALGITVALAVGLVVGGASPAALGGNSDGRGVGSGARGRGCPRRRGRPSIRTRGRGHCRPPGRRSRHRRRRDGGPARSIGYGEVHVAAPAGRAHAPLGGTGLGGRDRARPPECDTAPATAGVGG